MEFTFLIIVFALSITFSNIFNRIVPVIPLPIVQIIVGVLIGLTKMGQEIEFEPEVFLVMIIAPLLFREGELINLKAMMKNFGMILFLAFFGVLITLVGVGWTLHMDFAYFTISRLLRFWSGSRANGCGGGRFVIRSN